MSSTLDRVDWNAELVGGDLGQAVQQLELESGKGLFVGGVMLPLELASLSPLVAPGVAPGTPLRFGLNCPPVELFSLFRVGCRVAR